MLFILGLAVMIFVSWIIIKIRVKYFTETRELKYRLNTLSDVILYFLSAFFNQGSITLSRSRNDLFGNSIV